MVSDRIKTRRPRIRAKSGAGKAYDSSATSGGTYYEQEAASRFSDDQSPGFFLMKAFAATRGITDNVFLVGWLVSC